MSKTCCACRQDLPDSEFNVAKRNSTGLASRCRTCANAYLKDHYEANKAAYLTKARSWESRQRDIIRAKKAGPCADCGGKFHYSVMDFDHLPGSRKAFTVAGGHKRGIQAVLDEIAKCDLVCANCHRIRTYNRRTVRAA